MILSPTPTLSSTCKSPKNFVGPLTSDEPWCLSSFEIAELLLLLGAKKLVDCGLHASVRDDQSREQTCFCVAQRFDLLLIYVFTADCKQLLSCSPKRRHQRLETMLFLHHYLLDSFKLGGRQAEICSQRGIELKG